jgi:alditol oxidase
MPMATVNWAGNVRFSAAEFARPASVAELQRLVARSPRIRPIGTGHSFNPIADTDGVLVTMAGLPGLIELDGDRATVRVAAGLRYSDLAPRLHARGLALPNLASLPHISIAGAVATGTHGSGDGNGILATSVVAIELVTNSGDVVTVGNADLPGMVVGLGACGVVCALTLQAVPAFDVRQYVFQGVPFARAIEHFDDISASGYSVSMFTDWRAERFTQVWLKLTDQAEPTGELWFGGTAARHDLHPIEGMPAENCTPQLGLPGPWHERLPHFRAEFTPSAGNELQSEYLLPREHAADALAALTALSADLAAVTQVSEVRTVAADELWLSPAYQRGCAAFHFTWVPEARTVLPIVARVEAALADFAARPHWGKVFHKPGRYPRLDDFCQLVGEMDPDGKFSNDMLDQLLRRSGSG